MNPKTVEQWLIKAGNDFQSALNLLDSPVIITDSVCFHSQQAAEKYLKAYLVFNGREIHKTHDIALLIKECMAIDSSFAYLLEKEVHFLTPYGTVIRYPDDFYIPDVEESKEAMRYAEIVRDFVRARLSEEGFIMP